MMKRSRIMLMVVVPAGLATLLVAATVSAGDGQDKELTPQRQARLLEQYGEEGIDADGDGKLTPEEVRAFFADKGIGKGRRKAAGQHKGMRRGPGGAMRLYHAIETLQVLNPDEVPAGNVLALRPQLDSDEDGQLSAEEWSAFATQRRERISGMLLRRHSDIDADENGAISDDELQVFQADLEGKVREQILANHPEVDTNEDGTISDEEFEAMQTQHRATQAEKILKRHPEADTDGDGVLSADEMMLFQALNARGFAGGRRGGPRGWRGEHGPRGFGGPRDQEL